MKKQTIPNSSWAPTFVVFSRLVGWIMMIWAIYWILLKLTGHSPTLAEISINISFGIVTVGSTLFVVLFQMVYNLRNDVTQVQERTRNIERMVETVVNDLKQHIQDTKNRH